jgi:hypothetical protein
LPVTAGAAAAEVLSGWPDAPAIVGAVLCWLAWGIGSIAVLAPRPAGLTALRALAPAYAVGAVVVAITGGAVGLDAWAAVVATVVTAVLVADHGIATTAANAVAYGDERRYPLRTPPALFLGPLPGVRGLVVAGIAGGPLLLADEHWIVGGLAVATGLVVVPLGTRALHALSRRWIVLVPAGVVLADPLTLSDPTLFLREHVRALRPVEPHVATTGDALDLRLGASWGTLRISLDEPVDLLRSGRGRRGGATVDASELLVAVTRRSELLETASRRRVRVEVR